MTLLSCISESKKWISYFSYVGISVYLYMVPPPCCSPEAEREGAECETLNSRQWGFLLSFYCSLLQVTIQIDSYWFSKEYKPLSVPGLVYVHHITTTWSTCLYLEHSIVSIRKPVRFQVVCCHNTNGYTPDLNTSYITCSLVFMDIESWNHRTVWMGRDLKDHLDPYPL